jgi:hypothetical protein
MRSVSMVFIRTCDLPKTPTMFRDRVARELAGDERAGRFARQKYRAAYREYLRQAWRHLSAAAAIGLGVTAVVAALVPHAMARGLIIGAGVTGTVAALSQWVVIASGVGPAYMGETAERWTAGELRRLRGSGWRLINHVSLDLGDLDHLLIGPGGVLAIETKWSASAWTDKRAERTVGRAIRQVEKAAAQVEAIPEYKGVSLPKPRCCVVLWGEGATDLAHRVHHQRVTVLPGAELKHRVEKLGLISPRLTTAQIDCAWRTLGEYVWSREEAEDGSTPMPPSLQELTLRFLGAVVAGLVAFLAAGEFLKLVDSLWIWTPSTVAAIGLAMPLRRIARLRPLVTGFQTGLIATLALAVVVEGHQILR